MDAKLNANIGDYVTWGCEHSAHEVVAINSNGVRISDKAFLVSNPDETQAGSPQFVSYDCDNFRVVQRASETGQETSDDQSQKADAGKSDPVLLEVDLADALAVVNRVLDYGKAKYGQRGGWKQVSIDRYDPAARRHRRARDTGEQFDAESGLDHMAHEITNLLFQLQTRIEQNPDIDFLTFNDPPQDHRKDI